jgi:hypothetical protein
MPVTTVMMRAGGNSDRRKAFAEQARAKVASGGRNKLLTTLEHLVKNAKFTLRPLRYAMARTKNRKS